MNRASRFFDFNVVPTIEEEDCCGYLEENSIDEQNNYQHNQQPTNYLNLDLNKSNSQLDNIFNNLSSSTISELEFFNNINNNNMSRANTTLTSRVSPRMAGQYHKSSRNSPNKNLVNTTTTTTATNTTTMTTHPHHMSTSSPTPQLGRASYEQNESYSYLSEAEAAILRSDAPLYINETEEITVNGQRGIWVNKNEIVNWRGVLPITQYEINQDSNPEIVRKRTQQQINYIQELAIRYLKPPTPPPPGEILICQEINTLTPPAPPLIIRQQPPRPMTPQPLVIREAPPQPPPQQGRKVYFSDKISIQIKIDLFKIQK